MDILFHAIFGHVKDCFMARESLARIIYWELDYNINKVSYTVH